MFHKFKKSISYSVYYSWKKPVNIILMAVGLICLCAGYRNNFDIQKTMADIIQAAATWKNTAGLPVH